MPQTQPAMRTRGVVQAEIESLYDEQERYNRRTVNKGGPMQQEAHYRRFVARVEALTAERDSLDDTQYDIVEGDIVTLPNGTKVEVLQVDHDGEGNYFTCTEDGEDVWYYTSILDRHPANAEFID